jgi:hypothetical protein
MSIELETLLTDSYVLFFADYPRQNNTIIISGSVFLMVPNVNLDHALATWIKFYIDMYTTELDQWNIKFEITKWNAA